MTTLEGCYFKCNVHSSGAKNILRGGGEVYTPLGIHGGPTFDFRTDCLEENRNLYV